MKSKIILLVEDNADDELLTLRALRSITHICPIIVVHDGDEALDWLYRRGVHADRDASLDPQLILLDLGLPKIDGLGVLRAIRADAAMHRMPIVVLTSSGQDRDVIESFQLGANSFVCKPVGFEAFMEAVKQLGLYWLTLNQSR
jgi:two-component system response regulator